MQNCDLLIAIGARLDNIVTAYNPKGFARAARKVVVDVDLNELTDKTAMAIDQPLAMDAGVFMLADATPGDTAEWRARCADWKARYTQNEGRVFPPSGPISHAHFVDALSAAAPETPSSPPVAPASRWSSSTRAFVTRRASGCS